MKKRPNIILVMTDQQRWDTIASYGWSNMITPNLDQLAREGTAFLNAYAQATVCGPSRNSIVSSKYVHAHGIERNERWLPSSEPNWIDRLRISGYRTANLGKMHTSPLRLSCGFDYRLVVENKNYEQGKMGPPDDYDLYLKDHGLERPAQRYFETIDNWYDNLGATVWPYDEDLFPDNFIGRRSCEYIEQYAFDAPLFMWVGFAGPHDPYDVPISALDQYQEIDLPEPVRSQNEIETKPREHADVMQRMDGRVSHAAIWWSRATPARIQRMRRHYCANVSLIDSWVGKLRRSLARAGQTENTIVLFTSDHGDCLGDHDLVYKFWAHYDSIVKVPLIFAGGPVQSNQPKNDLVEMIDIGPTVLELAGVAADGELQGTSLVSNLTERAGTGKVAVFSEQGHRLMIRTTEWKMVYYAGKPYGELYNMEQDPDELENMYANSAYTVKKAELTTLLLDWYSDTRFRRS